jgi:hypothetical protein
LRLPSDKPVLTTETGNLADLYYNRPMRTRRLLFVSLPFALVFAACTVQPKSTLEATPPLQSEQATLSYSCAKGETALTSFQKNHGKIESDGNHWKYFINGKAATVDADSYVCEGNEEIKWELK